jgi:hypothetical protein
MALRHAQTPPNVTHLEAMQAPNDPCVHVRVVQALGEIFFFFKTIIQQRMMMNHCDDGQLRNPDIYINEQFYYH